jgi:hypothetical protein
MFSVLGKIKKAINNKNKKTNIETNTEINTEINTETNTETAKSKYEIYGKSFEEKGYLRPIYKSEKVIICAVSEFCYYFIEPESGLLINIKSEAMLNIIENPEKIVKSYLGLSDSTKKLVSFIIDMPGIEKAFISFKNASSEESYIVPEMEQKVFDLYGYPESSFPGNEHKQND